MWGWFGGFLWEGRQERGWVHSGCVRSRMLRIAKYSAGTLWLWTVAAPSTTTNKFELLW